MNKRSDIKSVVAYEEQAQIFEHPSETTQRQCQTFMEASTLIER